jgi:hypothetical protein
MVMISKQPSDNDTLVKLRFYFHGNYLICSTESCDGSFYEEARIRKNLLDEKTQDLWIKFVIQLLKEQAQQTTEDPIEVVVQDRR